MCKKHTHWSTISRLTTKQCCSSCLQLKLKKKRKQENQQEVSCHFPFTFVCASQFSFGWKIRHEHEYHYKIYRESKAAFTQCFFVFQFFDYSRDWYLENVLPFQSHCCFVSWIILYDYFQETSKHVPSAALSYAETKVVSEFTPV